MTTQAHPIDSPIAALPSPPRADPARIALFVDVDGTLLDIASHPDAVVVDASLRDALARLRGRLDGALAPLSGRPLREIDALLRVVDGAAAGLHGAELRGPSGDMLAKPTVPRALDAAKRRAIAAAAALPGVLVEDKGGAIALHYRAAPGAGSDVRRMALALLDLAGSDYELQPGNAVVELKPRHADKGTALAALMDRAPFLGRVPWMLGDDLTDEDAFVEVNRRGGVSIIVGSRRPTAARHALAGPGAARAWLAALAGADVSR